MKTTNQKTRGILLSKLQQLLPDKYLNIRMIIFPFLLMIIVAIVSFDTYSLAIFVPNKNKAQYLKRGKRNNLNQICRGNKNSLKNSVYKNNYSKINYHNNDHPKQVGSLSSGFVFETNKENKFRFGVIVFPKAIGLRLIFH